MSELYEEDLNTLITVLDCLEDLSKVEGLFEVEIRVRVDDVDTWAVVGYGESGDPCVLRFESAPELVNPWPSLPNTTLPRSVVTYTTADS